MKELCASFNNVHFLDRTSLEIECNGKKLVFLGCVLWANVPDDCKQLVGLVGCQFVMVLTTYRV